jgi:folate-binding protein YgfZ
LVSGFSNGETHAAGKVSLMERAAQHLEYHAIHSGAGSHVIDNRLIVRVSGDDRITFMHGMCTADVNHLPPGNVTRALFLTERAHVIADVFIYVLEEQALWLEVERARWPAVRAHLERFLVADDVELEELDGLTVLDIEGPASPDPVAEYFGDDIRELNQWRHLARNGLRIASLPRYGGPAFTIIGDETGVVSAAGRIRNLGSALCELHAATLELLRIENGLALVGTDTDERTLALEARLESAIAFHKGCYVGQETIERATAHGALKRRLCGLRIAGDEIPQAGALIRLEGKEIGRLSSVAHSPQAGVIGLGILHHSVWPAGTRVSIIGDAGTFSASVSELPFGPRSAVMKEASVQE